MSGTSKSFKSEVLCTHHGTMQPTTLYAYHLRLNPDNNGRTPKVLTLEEQLKQFDKDKIENRKNKEKERLKKEEKYEEIKYVPTSSGFYRL